jgi:hypothetical protein
MDLMENRVNNPLEEFLKGEARGMGSMFTMKAPEGELDRPVRGIPCLCSFLEEHYSTSALASY